MEIKNSAGKVIGEITISDNEIIINNFSKPELIINDFELIKKIKEKDESAFNILWEEYTLLIGEIASLYNVAYATARKHLIKKGINTSSLAGRRNSSYGKTFSEERKRKIGEKSRGRKILPYERTPEIKEKISNGLKEYYATHEVSKETREKLSQAWTRGCYNNSPMGRGYSGYFYSPKNKKDYFFRSLLELNYLIIIEQDETVESYTVEPFQIKLTNNHHYTPDVLINNELIIELKPRNHLNWENVERWEEEMHGLKEYCKKHNYSYKVVYDDDISFETKQFKKWFINNSDELLPYNIRLNRDFIWS